MKTRTSFPNCQRGVMLLEALIAILIFSIGILAIVGLQVNSIKLAGDAKYRSDANLLANRLLGEMWLAQSSPSFATDFSGNAYCTGTSPYCLWATSAVAATLPTTGVSAPAVTIVQSTSPASSSVSSTVTIDIYWNTPGEGSHQYSTHTQINN